jgi:putative ATP-binding cassette transporter
MSKSHRIQTIEADRLAVEHLSLQTPNYQRTLVEDLSVELAAGQGLLVMGSSGCGKSSLLRAIAGLWNSGKGAIVRPEPDQIPIFAAASLHGAGYSPRSTTLSQYSSGG